MEPIKTTKQYLSNDVTSTVLYIPTTKKDSAEESVEEIVNNLKNNPDFELREYASEEKLSSDLKRKIFGGSESKKLTDIIPFVNEISEIFESTLKKSNDLLDIEYDITVYILPMCNEQVSKDLKGVNAFTMEDNMLYLLIDIDNPDWRESLVETIPHEYAHLVYVSKYNWNSILDGIVNEGLSEHFREFVVGGDVAPWSKALTKEKALSELESIPDEILNLFIDDSNIDVYLSYFFGTKELPNWYGYSIGYWLVDEILEKKEMSIIDLFDMSPKEILGLMR